MQEVTARPTMQKLNDRLYSWASIIDPQTRKQAEVASTMPFIHPHLALMPDAHLGRGATVGSVIPTLGVLMPAAVGVDIGCGMIAVRTQFVESDIAGLDRKALRQNIEWSIPLSMGNFNRTIKPTAEPRIAELERMAAEALFDPADYAPNWRMQLGTLGSGNHFIEVSIDEESRVWLFLHSGSRGVGNKIATHHIQVAQDYCKRHWIQLPRQPKMDENDGKQAKVEQDLAYLVEGTNEFAEYVSQLRWAQHFALLNREEMMERLIDQFQRWVGQPIVESERINCHHNYTTKERHFGREVWLSRKGAIDANVGVAGLIPGSMGDKSYVVVGKGDPMSLCSSPHGAGRAHGRKQAERLFKVDDFKEVMLKAGVEWNEAKAETFLDECPAAYKAIDVVMEDARDLVTVTHTLHAVINVKGD